MGSAWDTGGGVSVPDVRIVTDSTAYLPQGWISEHGIELVSLSVNEDGRRPERELDMDWAAFYSRMRDSRVLPKSSQPVPEELIDVFEAAATRGAQVCAVFLSSGLSGTLSGAGTARADVLSRHPDAVIELVDSQTTSAPLAYIVRKAAVRAAEGGDAAQCAETARRAALCARWLVMPAGLENLRKGGRIGGAAALVGSALQILPILTVENGSVELLKRVRTRRRQLEEAVAFFRDETASAGSDSVAVLQIEESAERDEVVRRVTEVCGRQPDLLDVGPVVGLHVGPAVGIAYLTERPIHEVAA
jgi:DegV family protein with EDD domain